MVDLINKFIEDLFGYFDNMKDCISEWINSEELLYEVKVIVFRNGEFVVL